MICIKKLPEKADFIISQWEEMGKSKAQDWIIKHGRRNQNKQGLFIALFVYKKEVGL